MKSRLALLASLVLTCVAPAQQDQGRITGVSITPSNTVRLVIEPYLTDPNRLLLQSADSLLGPWWKEPDFERKNITQGLEFLTPHKAFYPERFYRFERFAYSPVAGAGLPYIRFVSPNTYVVPGQVVSLLGANFGPAPDDNSVTFALPSQSWTAKVVEAATNYLIAIVPTNLVFASTGTLYRVTVTTSKGTGNGVGCSVCQSAGGTFALRPKTANLVQPPGSGQQTLVVGGGVPPYHLVPLSDSDLKVAEATIEGPVVTVTARTNVKYGGITVSVQDSSQSFPVQDWASVNVLTVPFSPGFGATFHTLLGGTMPGVTINVTNSTWSNGNLQIERLELQLENAGLEVSRVAQRQVVGVLKFLDPYNGIAGGFHYLAITEVAAGRAKFDVISSEDGGIRIDAQGVLIESPPTVVIHVLDLNPRSLVPQPLAEELILADSIVRLPTAAGQSFSMTANFTSVSAREDTYLPQRASVTNHYTSTALASGAPRIDRLLPVHGEVARNVGVRGVGFSPNPGENAITFAGLGGVRVTAEIVLQTNDEITVTVPPGAVSGPVRLTVAGKTSNDYLFFVRFHPETELLFDSFSNNVPTGLELLHQQPSDDGETAGEVPLQSVVCTLAGGHIVITNLALDQLVGTTITTSFSDGTQRTNLIVYAGRETNAPQRYLFKEVSYAGSSYTLARFYYSENTNEVTLQLATGDKLFPFYAGGVYDFHFTTPIYQPSDRDVAVRVETVSQQWLALPGSEMRRIINFMQPVQ